MPKIAVIYKDEYETMKPVYGIVHGIDKTIKCNGVYFYIEVRKFDADGRKYVNYYKIRHGKKGKDQIVMSAEFFAGVRA